MIGWRTRLGSCRPWEILDPPLPVATCVMVLDNDLAREAAARAIVL